MKNAIPHIFVYIILIVASCGNDFVDTNCSTETATSGHVFFIQNSSGELLQEDIEIEDQPVFEAVTLIGMTELKSTKLFDTRESAFSFANKMNVFFNDTEEPIYHVVELSITIINNGIITEED